MNRTLRKAVMNRSTLNRRLNRITINFENYKKQLNISVNILRKVKNDTLITLTLKM